MKRCAISGLLVLMLVGCGGGGTPAPVAARPYQDPGFVADGDFEIRYGTLLAVELTPGLANAYGIDRRSDLAILSLSVLRRRPGETSLPVVAEVSGFFSGLLGEVRPLEFRTLDLAGGVSYLAQFKVRDRQPVVLQLEARPSVASARVLRARIVREFSIESR